MATRNRMTGLPSAALILTIGTATVTAPKCDIFRMTRPILIGAPSPHVATNIAKAIYVDFTRPMQPFNLDGDDSAFEAYVRAEGGDLQQLLAAAEENFTAGTLPAQTRPLTPAERKIAVDDDLNATKS